MAKITDTFFIDTAAAERALVAELIHSPSDLPEVQRIVNHEMFNTKARAVFELIAGLFGSGQADLISIPSIYARVDVEDKDYFRDVIMAEIPTGSVLQMRDCATTIRNAFESRRLFLLSETLRQAALQGTDLPEALEAIRKYQNEEADAVGTRAISVEAAFNNLCDDLETRRGRVATLIKSLDSATYGGFAGGNIVILAARPSVGKTSVALDMARNMASPGAKIAFFSLEMSAGELAQKLCLGTERLDAEDFRRDSLDWNKIEAAGKEICAIDIMIDDRSRTLDEICTQIVLMHSAGECTAAFIDYLGLIEVTKDTRVPLAIQLSIATRRLKLLAKELQIPIVVLCQLNRDASKDKRSPELHDLRDSGAIEQDADMVLMLERACSDLNHSGGDLDSHTVFIWVRKNRGGKAGNYRIDLKANETFSRFTEIEGNILEDSIPMPGPSAETASARTAAEPEDAREAD